MDMKGLGWRVSLSIIVSLGWLVFLVIWLFFYAESFSLYQNIAIFIASILVLAAIMGASWAPWGMRQEHRDWERYREDHERPEEKERKPAPKRKGKK
jgi:hypothetical protein